MTELTPSDITKFAQKAMILRYQIDELEKMMDSYQSKGVGLNMRVVAESYNKALDDCRKVFSLDDSFVDGISHLKKVEIIPDGRPHQQHIEVRKMVPQLKILKATLNAFFEWLKHKEEKEKT